MHARALWYREGCAGSGFRQTTPGPNCLQHGCCSFWACACAPRPGGSTSCCGDAGDGGGRGNGGESVGPKTRKRSRVRRWRPRPRRPRPGAGDGLDFSEGGCGETEGGGCRSPDSAPEGGRRCGSNHSRRARREAGPRNGEASASADATLEPVGAGLRECSGWRCPAPSSGYSPWPRWRGFGGCAGHGMTGERRGSSCWAPAAMFAGGPSAASASAATSYRARRRERGL